MAKKKQLKMPSLKIELKQLKEPKDAREKEPVAALFSKERVLTENSDAARDLYNLSRFGTLLEDGRVSMSIIEAIYLVDKKRLSVYDARNKIIDFDTLLSKAQRSEPKFWTRYMVYRDIRNRGYIIKTALKFGADFRIYDRGIKPGEDHAKWVVFPVHEAESLTWHEFSSKNRVAHSTKKRLLIGAVDDEGDCTYWEVRWLRP